jgi:hypothetical protein
MDTVAKEICFESVFFHNLRRIEVYLTKIMEKNGQNQVFFGRISILGQAPST